jgi:hypothetical protein
MFNDNKVIIIKLDNITDYDYLTNSITSQEKNFFTTLIPIYDKLDIVTLSIVPTLIYVTFGANWFLDYQYIFLLPMELMRG